MKAAFSLFLIFNSLCSFACELNRPIISLSGPLTMMLEEMNLLGDKNLVGISNFHPVKTYDGQIFSGGLFLSKSVLNKNSEAFIFYDRSREFLKLLKSSKHKFYKAVETRELTPFEVVADLLLSIDQFTSKCESAITKLELKMEKLQQKLSKIKGRNAVFFLGEIKSKLPELVIANDGFVTFLKQNKNYKTYPSTLSYVPWSKKSLSKLKDLVLVGIHEGKMFQLTKASSNRYNIQFRGILTPGIRQIYFLEKFYQLEFL